MNALTNSPQPSGPCVKRCKRSTIQELSDVLKCITENTDVVGFTIAEYLPFDEHRLNNLFAEIKLFNE